jgi:hypothetical protein
MTDQPSPDDLAEAERYFHRLARSWAEHGARSDAAALTALMAEYDRLRAVEQAARELREMLIWLTEKYPGGIPSILVYIAATDGETP